ncbi:MAG: 5'/3'-nucleotidase SurE [Deltaproteobacteria bacterium]|nr:5'/3'-nucleotidase SurE [Deltaproteobacteria bacterium]
MPRNERPLVLVTNDDGYAAAGLSTVVKALSRSMQVVVVAPEAEQSACSHALTLHRAMRLRTWAPHRHALDGTPADCVYVALFAGERLMPRRPDLVISGINRGLNLGLDVYYSGTVAAAREAAIRGVPGLAVSADSSTDLEAAARLCERMAHQVIALARKSDQPFVLNVNIPAGKRWKLRRTTSGRRSYGEGVDFRVDPRGREYLWIGAPGVRNHGEPGTDTEAFDRGEVGVSSLALLPRPEAADDAASKVVRLLSRPEPSRKKR